MQSFSFHRKTPNSKESTQERDAVIRLIEVSSAPPLGNIRSGRFELSLDGELAREVWLAVPVAFSSLTLDVFTFHPREFRAIVRDTSENGVVDAAVSWFMRMSTDQIQTLRGSSVTAVWEDVHIAPIATHEDLFQERMDILVKAKL